LINNITKEHFKWQRSTSSPRDDPARSNRSKARYSKRTPANFIGSSAALTQLPSSGFPKEDAEWDKKYPWAAGRRMEIVKDMAEQVRKKQAPSSTLKWEEGTVLLVSV
jgi:hypothetical protein